LKLTGRLRGPQLNGTIVSQQVALQPTSQHLNRRTLLRALAVSALGFACRRRPPGKVEVSFRVIRYAEPAGTIALGWEYFPEPPLVAYVPSPRRWRAQMPEWARFRRDEIFPEIQRQTRPWKFKWEEYE